MVITPTFTTNFQTFFGANSANAMAAWAAAAQQFTNAFSDDIHINITVDAVANPNVLGESFPQVEDIGYDELFQRLSASASTQTDLVATGSLGSVTPSDPTNGTATWQLTRAQAKALGVIPDDASDDGGTTFGVSSNTPYTFSGQIALNTFDFQGVAAHEISEIMGRFGHSGTNNTFTILDLFAYTGAGIRSLGGGAGNFFSIDNGTTLLKQFNDPLFRGDSRDWAGGTSDAFNAFGTRSVVNPLSAVDLQVMDAIGYGTANPRGSLIQTVGHIVFLRAHDVGTGYGKAPNDLDCEVIVKLAEDPLRAFGLQLRVDDSKAAHQQMFDMLRAAFIANRPARLDYITTGPLAGMILRVANP